MDAGAIYHLFLMAYRPRSRRTLIPLNKAASRQGVSWFTPTDVLVPTSSLHEEADIEELSTEVRQAIKRRRTSEHIPCAASENDQPPWSVQDRFERYYVVRPLGMRLMQSNMCVVGAYIIFLATMMSLEPGCHIAFACALIPFILWHLLVVLFTSIPDNASSTEELRARVDGIIFLAMVLYPCLGSWCIERTAPWTLPDLEAFIKPFELVDGVRRYQWGYVFPFVMWGMSSCIILQEGYKAFTQDRVGVARSASTDDRKVTCLYRRLPSTTERILVCVLRACLLSAWDLVPTRHRPPGGAGRFVMQLLSPVVLLFQYIGFRFVAFSWQELGILLSDGLAGRKYHTLLPGVPLVPPIDLKGGGVSVGGLDVCISRLVVWAAFLFLCVAARLVIPSHAFLRLAVPDRHTREHRQPTWQRLMVDCRSARVLWGFRGLTYALVPYLVARWPIYYTSHTTGAAVVLYLYVCVWLSFLFEGLGAFLFGLLQAERGCELRSPLALWTKWFFWAAYNAYLQPQGTAVNLFCVALNREYRLRLPPREIFAPILDDEGHLPRWLVLLFTPRPPKLTTEATDALVYEWTETYERKRQANGRPSNIAHVHKGDGFDSTCVPAPPRVFCGTMLPSREEWLFGRDNPSASHALNVPILDFEEPFKAEKFLRWYPSYAESVQRLLGQSAASYSFDVSRVVYMFGYGSLMSPDNPPHGLTSLQLEQMVPYWLKATAGFRREWNYRHGTAGITALGLEKAASAADAMNVCGCIYPIDYEVACDLFCSREDGYELLLVHQSHLAPMHPDYAIPDNVGYVWLCGRPTADWSVGGKEDKRHPACADFPVLQSYVDTILTGALRYATSGIGHADGMNFAAALLCSIGGWDDGPWMDDRLLPGRPWRWVPEWQLVDGLLSTCHASREAFRRRMRPAGTGPIQWASIQRLEQSRWADWSTAYYPAKRTRASTVAMPASEGIWQFGS